MDILIPLEATIELRDLHLIGIDAVVVAEEFLIEKHKVINLNDILKVSADEEGKYINVETSDSTTIIIPPHLAAGNWNKISKEF